MILYLHMHKCAGTSVVRAAAASGLRLPAQHQNGNLIAADDRPIKYRGMPSADLAALLDRQSDAGVQFMAMEWDFPRPEQFAGTRALRTFTSLRDPLARAISNFRMDKVAGHIDPAVRFGDYINGDALYCSDNYYVKMLCQLWPKDHATPADLAFAMDVLASFEAVIVIEQANMPQVLARFGITPEATRHNAFHADPAHYPSGDDPRLWISDREIRDFIARNTLDYALYCHCTRAIRLADRSRPCVQDARNLIGG